MPVLGVGAWVGALVATHGSPPVRAVVGIASVLVSLCLLLVALRSRTRPAEAGLRGLARTAAAAMLVGWAVAGVALLRTDSIAADPLTESARLRASVELSGVVTSDPRIIVGAYGERVLVRVSVARHAPVLVFGDDRWRGVVLGQGVRFTGRLAPADGDDLAAVVTPRGPPTLTSPPGLAWRVTGMLRASIRDSVAHRPETQRGLVPALVDGDDAGLPEGLRDDFQTTGLTHLTAVSGTNLTLVVGFLLVVARWSGVRGRWLGLVAGVGIVGFVLLARTEPSVLRAAAMGVVALIGLGSGGARGGMRALGVAVVGLLLVSPGLGNSMGFALSALATAGILLLAPAWRDALGRWMPRWLAEAIAVPTAAQLACTPLVAAISGQVSLVAVLANLLVAPVVGPATVLGLLGGVLGLAWDFAGRVAGTGASWCVAWIVVVAEHGAALPGAAVSWESGVVSMAVLVVLTALVALAGPLVVRRRAPGAMLGVLMLAVTVLGPPNPSWLAGWPPDGWLFVACDVGQGDALAIRTGPGAAVVVDAGPEPRAVDACLRRLGVKSVPLVVLTHFHADHVNGLDGVLRRREVGEVDVTALADPPEGVELVRRAVAAAGVESRVAAYGETRRVGEVVLQTLWPLPTSPTRGPGDGSTANEASVVLVVEVRGVRLLLTGDLEPPGQAALQRLLPDLDVDVLKVPHHGSRFQDPEFLISLGARLAIVSVGADNDYGHPAAETLDLLGAAGLAVLRTDQDGDIAVVLRDGVLAVETRR